MFRHTAFGIAFTTVLFGSGLTTIPVPGHSSTKKIVDTRFASGSSPLLASASINSRAMEKAVFEQINRYRTSQGLPKLKLNSKVARQARFHSQNMAMGKAPFSHDGFKVRVSDIPIAYKSAAENLAYNQGYSDPVQEAVKGWLESPSHLKNIKGNYNLTGVGVATNSQGEVYLTQIFMGSP